ncbi:hypothetical protein F7734_36890 [Scytonema sp. UIC 10036]|uniref:hypothetical protein n=1 Tax=Scytonema sp. UIC 10036 TaxID=2304196 RepID=UPI0012DA7C5E|nr:hypothetical protein [Scytonema sp. UIC 10036]MUG97600.1 hypothetical protein [Scytonema sp. UIC 10036]
MIKRTVSKFLLASTAGSVIGLATIISSISNSLAAVQSVTINTPNTHSISHIVLFLQSPSGTISRVKIDGFPDGIMSYDPTKILSENSDSKLIAYSVKAGNNKVGDTSDGKPVFIDKSLEGILLPTTQADQNNTPVYDYKKYPTGSSTIPVASNPAPEPTAPESPTPDPEVSAPESPTPDPEVSAPVASNPPSVNLESSQPDSGIPHGSKTTQVPEPGAIAALAFFGLSGLLAKKKVK